MLCRGLIKTAGLRQVAPAETRPNQSDPAVTNIRKAVAAAQRQGENTFGTRTCIKRFHSHFVAGSNHPLRIGHNFETTTRRGNTNSSGQRSISLAWPRSGSASRRTSVSVPDPRNMGQGAPRPLVLPKFVTEPKSLYNGYQEAHKLYDEMRYFFAQKASAAHNGEVVVIKVTMMTLKPGNKNPVMVSVRYLKVVLTDDG